MPTVQRPSGLELDLPAGFTLDQPAVIAATPRRAPGVRRFGPVPMPQADLAAEHTSWQRALIVAFEQQEMTQVDHWVLAPVTSTDTRLRAAGPPELRVDVPLAEREDAVILLEQDGLYSWQFPAVVTPTPPGTLSPRRGQPAAGQVSRQARFLIPLATGEPVGGGPTAPRGVVGDVLQGRVRAYVFKFAARLLVGQAMPFLERRVQRGLLHLPGNDPATWRRADPARLPLPADRPARVLLLVHGTFSSTISAYGALAATPWGQAFLAATFATYDLVLGFDHATLSEDPLANASELLSALQAIPWPAPPRLDAVCHSRGGLVLRSLLEQLLPLTDFHPQVGRVVFVGVTNGGTLLAEPANWQVLVDLYTNLAVTTCQLVGQFPQARAVTTVLEETVRSLGAFVKYLAATTVTERGVPGLAAMEPAGEFITWLNQVQPGQPTIAQSNYYAVTSEFRPQVLGGEHEPRELPARLVQWLAGGLMRALMREPNDLVVNTAAMTRIDPAAGNYLKDVLALGENPQVYHTNYFIWPPVLNALARWLQLAEPNGSLVEPQPPAAGRTRRAVAPANAREPGRFVTAELPVTVDLNVLVLLAEITLGEALAEIKMVHPSFVVVRQLESAAPRDYVFTAEEVLVLVRRAAAQSLAEALRLRQLPPSASYSGGSLPAQLLVTGPAAPTSASHAVVLRQGQPVGVLPPARPLPTSAELLALARQISQPRREVDLIHRRRALPTLGRETLAGGLPPLQPLLPRGSALAGLGDLHTTRGGRETVAASKPTAATHAPKKAAPDRQATGGSRPRKNSSQPVESASVTCHFRAEMDQVVAIGRLASVEVQLAREELLAAASPTTANQSAEVQADQSLLVQVIPRVNFALVDEAARYRVEVPVPAAGNPCTLTFNLRATHAGEGEVWVQIFQQQVPLLTLSLQPQIAASPAVGPVTRVQVGATASELTSTSAVHQLTILERRNGTELTYEFLLQLPSLQVLARAESQPFTGDRQQYVEHLYEEIEQRWLSSQADAENFTAELRALGGTLFDELIPVELQALLWQHRRELNSILVLSEEPFIPWELVHLHAPGQTLPGDEQYFLGQLGLTRWLHAAGWPPEALRLRPGKGRYIIPHYPHSEYQLPAAEQEELFLREELQAKRVAPTAQAVRKLVQEPGELDFLHFAGHGEVLLGNIANAQLLLQGRVEGGNYLPEYLSANTVRQYANIKSARPLVVLNACQAGRAGYQLTGIGGFARSFLLAGASAFVGALWSVGDQPARTFTEEFYHRLRAGDSLAQATTAARKAAQLAGDATWLAYTVYGHPHAKATTR